MLRKLLAAAGVVMVVFFVIGTVGVIQEEREDMVYSQDAILELSDIRCENIGDQYKEQEAADGYSFYRIVWTLENESIYEAYAGSLYFYYSSADESSYDDVYMPEADSGRDVFYYSNEPVIPAGRTTDIESIVGVKDGVERIRVEYRLNYEDDYENMELNLQE